MKVEKFNAILGIHMESTLYSLETWGGGGQGERKRGSPASQHLLSADQNETYQKRVLKLHAVSSGARLEHSWKTASSLLDSACSPGDSDTLEIL